MNTISKRSILRVPVLQALVIQCISLILLTVILKGIWTATGFSFNLYIAALVQGLIAALLSKWCKLAFWWVLIQAVFPVVALATYALNLPSSVFLLLFVFLLSLYWTTFRTQVPFYPSGPAAWDAVLRLLPADRPIRFIDIGSGLGGLVLNLANHRPDSVFVGIESAPLPWFISQTRRWLGGSSARFIRGDYDDHHLGQYDVVFAYLSPAAMTAISSKAKAEMRAATLLLSYEFPIVGMAPQICINDESGGPMLYGWHI